MSAVQVVPKLAARRPDWELPQLHEGLQLSSHEPLEAKGRKQCPKCQRSRPWYCYDCLEPLTECPKVELPFKLSIVTHHEEAASKNTGVQAAVLAKGHVELHDMAHFPAGLDVSRCVVLFPSDDALNVEQLEPDSIDRAFIIDSRWKKAAELLKLPAFAGMRRVKLSQTKSAFWRFHTQGVSDEGVCTIECVYFFLQALIKEGKVTGAQFTQPHAFDDLLWYFVYQHKVVAEAAAKRQEAALAAGSSGAAPAAAVQAKHGQTKLQKQIMEKLLEQAKPSAVQGTNRGDDAGSLTQGQADGKVPDASALASGKQGDGVAVRQSATAESQQQGRALEDAQEEGPLKKPRPQ